MHVTFRVELFSHVKAPSIFSQKKKKTRLDKAMLFTLKKVWVYCFSSTTYLIVAI